MSWNYTHTHTHTEVLQVKIRYCWGRHMDEQDGSISTRACRTTNLTRSNERQRKVQTVSNEAPPAAPQASHGHSVPAFSRQMLLSLQINISYNTMRSELKQKKCSHFCTQIIMRTNSRIITAWTVFQQSFWCKTLFSSSTERWKHMYDINNAILKTETSLTNPLMCADSNDHYTTDPGQYLQQISIKLGR